jgi:hypothetical protein
MTIAWWPGRTVAEGSAVALPLPQFQQQLAYPPCSAQFAGDVGRQAQVTLGIEPAGLDIRRQLAHGLGKSRKNFFDLARSEPPFPGHARHLPTSFRKSLVQPSGNTEAVVQRRSKKSELIAVLRRRPEAGGV